MRLAWDETCAAPERFAEAVEVFRAAIAECEQASIPRDAVLAAMMTELMPRLVDAFGPTGVGMILSRVAGAVVSMESRNATRQ